MGIFRRNGLRRATMPRSRPEIESNKIQSPELVRSLQQGLGMRQMHVAPTVGSEITPVVVVRDLTDTVSAMPAVYRVFEKVLPDGLGPIWMDLINPPDHDRMVRVIRCGYGPLHGGIMNLGTANIGTLPGTLKRGSLVSRGKLPSDMQARASTRVGCFGANGTTSGVGTFYEQQMPLDAAVPVTHMPFEHFPQGQFLGPGSAFVMFTDLPPLFETLFVFEWEEMPLT